MKPNESAVQSPRWWSVLLALFMASALALADDSKDKKSTPSPSPAPTPRPAQSAHGKAAAAKEPHEGTDREHPAARAAGASTEHGSTHGTGSSAEHGTTATKGTRHEAPPATGASVEPGTTSARTGAEHRATPVGGSQAEHGNTHATESSPEHGTTSTKVAPRHETRPPTGAGVEPGIGGVHATPSPTGANTAHGAAAGHPVPSTTTHEFKNAAGQRVQATYRDGQVRSIQAPNLRIDHGLHGDRRIVTEGNGRRIVTVGPHTGYSQRSYTNRGGHDYVQRTYFVGGKHYAYAYRTYSYRGAHYYAYAPAHYYRPAYYRWAYNPWPAPVYYRWGWDAQPWYGYYGYYFSPYPAYPTASMWLTDFIIGESLRVAFESHPSGRVAPGGAPVALEEQLDPDVKEAIANEVRQQIEAEQVASANLEPPAWGAEQAPPALAANSRIFVVASPLDTTMSTGEPCSLTPGDVLLRANARAGEDNNVDVIVASSKKDDCYAGSTVSIDLGDLQEMHNHLRQLLDTGLRTLADNSGRDGLPAAPDTVTRSGEVPEPAIDANVESDAQQQQSAADRIEAEASPQD